jgi:O-antigen ligase
MRSVTPAHPGFGAASSSYVAPARSRAVTLGGMDGLRWALVILTILTVSRVHQHFGFLAVTRPALLLALVALGYSMAKPSLLSGLPWAKSWPAKVVMGIGIWACVSAPFGLSLGGSGRMIIESFSKVLIFSFLLMATTRGVADLRRYIWAYVIAAALLVWMSLFVFGLQKASGDGFYRLNDLYTYDANDVGVMLLAATGLVLLAFQTSGNFGRVACGLILLGIGATIARTGSRGAFLGFLAMFLALLVFGRSVSPLKRVAFVVVTLLGLAIASPPGYWEQMKTSFKPKEDYNWTEPSGRRQLWTRGVGYMKTYPLFGVGIGQFPRAEGTISSIAEEWDPRLRGIRWSAPHNSFVEAGAELGLPGLVMWVSLTVGGIVSLWRLRRRVPRAWAKGDPDDRFLYHATSYLPVSYVAFTVSAFFVSFAWVDGIYILTAYLVGLHMAVWQRLRAGAMPGQTPAMERPSGERGGGWAYRTGLMICLAAATAVQAACGGDALAGPPPPPSATEPVYSASQHTSMFYDGFESYASTSSLTNGTGDYSYITLPSGLTGISLVASAAGEGSKKVAFDFTPAGDLDLLLETSNVSGDGPVVYVSWLFRNVGNVHHEKQFIIFKGGGQRFVYNIWGIVAPLSLASCFYDGGLYGTPKSPNIPPQGGVAPGWNSDPTGFQYQQNMGYQQFRMNDVINDGSWHRYTTRFEKERAGSGTGRIEVWGDGVKILEYLGDDPSRCEYQQVFTATISQELVSAFQFPTTTSGQFPWGGGATIEYDAIRIWR